MADIPIFQRAMPEEIAAYLARERFKYERGYKEKLAHLDQILLEIGCRPAYGSSSKFLGNFQDHILRVPPSRKIIVMRTLFDLAQTETGIPLKERAGAMMALAQTFQSIDPDPVHQHYMAEQKKVFQERLLNDTRVRDAFLHWKDCDDEERKSLLLHVGALQDEVFSHKTLKFASANIVFEYSPQDGIEGHLFRDKLSISTSVLHDWGSFPRKLGVLIHEKTHHHQRQIALMAKKNQLPLGSPFYRQGQEYKEYFSFSGTDLYVEPQISWDAYYAHPLEREARQMQEIAKRVCFFLTQKQGRVKPRRSSPGAKIKLIS